MIILEICNQPNMYVNDLALLPNSIYPLYFFKNIFHHRISKLHCLSESEFYILIQITDGQTNAQH